MFRIMSAWSSLWTRGHGAPDDSPRIAEDGRAPASAQPDAPVQWPPLSLMKHRAGPPDIPAFPKPPAPQTRPPLSKRSSPFVALRAADGPIVNVLRSRLPPELRDLVEDTGSDALPMRVPATVLRYCQAIWTGQNPYVLEADDIAAVHAFSERWCDDAVQISLLPDLIDRVLESPSSFEKVLWNLMADVQALFLSRLTQRLLDHPVDTTFSERFGAALDRQGALPSEVKALRDLGNIAVSYAFVPAGRFMMGSPLDEESRRENEAQYEVTLTKPYYLKDTPVTREEWEALMGPLPSSLFARLFQVASKDAKRPIVGINWFAAVAFCNALSKRMGQTPYYILRNVKGRPGTPNFKATVTVNPDGASGYRLPTEAEWEWAARGGCETARYGALADVAWFRTTRPQPVAEKRPNDYGLYDILGNVEEWTSGWYADHPPVGSVTDPQGPETGVFRVARGGSFKSTPHRVRAAARQYGEPQTGVAWRGFRPARSIPPSDSFCARDS